MSAPKLELHPLCTLFPRMVGADFEALKADIAQHGVRQPIVTHAGLILDGGNRYRACIELGVEPRIEEFEGDGIVAFVLSANLHRRHMTPGQQAAIVASAQDWAKAQARGGDRRSDQSQVLDFETVEQRAAAAGVSRVTQMKADKVAKEAPELAKKVAQGEVSLPAAVKQISTAERPPKPAPDQRPPAAAELPTRLARPVVANESEALPSREQQMEEMLAETMSENAALRAEVAALRTVSAADDKAAALLAELRAAQQEATETIAQKDAEIASLRERINGLMGEKNEAVRIAKAAQRKAGRAAA